jgi:very-short-patch-repair endonuclease
MEGKNINKCRELRKRQTDAEKKLWSILRNRQLAGAKFRRQFSVGNYLLDFYSPGYRLGIEADGGQHREEKRKQDDKVREKELYKLGIEIIRFNNNDILNNIEGAFEIIQKNLKRKESPSP